MRTAHATAGFTLIEMLVVVVIIGVIAAGVVLSGGLTSGDHELETESARLVTLMNYAREQAELQTREFGLSCTQHGYEFLAFDPRTSQWRSVLEDDALRARALPAGLSLQLTIETRPVVLGPPPPADKPKKPDIMIFSNGDLSTFQLTVGRDGATRAVVLASDEQGHIAAKDLPEKPT